jgi:hypothetical protein
MSRRPSPFLKQLRWVFGLAMSMATVPAFGETTEEALQILKAEAKVLNQRIEQLERRLEQESAARTPPEPKAVSQKTEASRVPESRRPLEIPEADISVTVGGRVKLDTIFNTVSVGGPGGSNLGDTALFPELIPVGKRHEDNQTSFSARESRLWVKSHAPTGYGNLNAYLEIDFSTSQALPGDRPGNERATNSYSPRLRHAYGTFGNLLVGQTWSTFMNAGAFPETNDANGPVGQIDVRQAQIRWTEPFDWGDVQIALENPETTLTDPGGVRATPDDDRFPDLALKLSHQGDWGQWSLAGLLREIRSDGGTASDEAFGGAVSLAGRIKTFGQDNLRFNLNYGNALGRYIALNAFNEGDIDAAGRVELSDVYGGFLAYQHWWGPRLRSTLAYSIAGADNDLTRVPATVTEWVESYHANLLWSPVLQATFGLEYIHARRELENGQDGELDRVQFSAIYNF